MENSSGFIARHYGKMSTAERPRPGLFMSRTVILLLRSLIKHLALTAPFQISTITFGSFHPGLIQLLYNAEVAMTLSLMQCKVVSDYRFVPPSVWPQMLKL